MKEGKLRNASSSITLALLFLSLFAFAFTLQTARAQSEGTIIINPDGSITPSNASITTSDNVTYTFTGNNYLPIIVNRSNIIINGMGHTLQISSLSENGFSLSGMSNVTIKNTTITNSNYGNILLSSYGIFLISSDNNTLSGNTVTANIVGIDFYASSGNVLSGNNVTANGGGIELDSSSDNNTLSGNSVTGTSYVGIELEYSCDNNTLSGNNITANNGDGIDLGYSCESNTFSGNNITTNIGDDGIGLYSSSGNIFYHNNFINNALQVYSTNSSNTWDNGAPSGGNYWSEYLARYPSATEIGYYAIWNTPYVIDANNTDRYPLMGPFNTFSVGTWNGTAYSVDTVSNYTITDLSFSATAKTLSFNVTGANGTAGFCRVTIPFSLMSGDFAVTANGKARSFSYSKEENYTYVYFTCHQGTETVKITSTSAIPEFQPYMLLPLLMIITLLTAAVSKRKRKVVHIGAC